MNIDEDLKEVSGPGTTTGVSTPVIGEAPVPDPFYKSKEPSVKKVCPLYSNSSFPFILLCLFQISEKRPEVIMIEYYEVPGMTVDDHFLFAQKLASNAKRLKTEHLSLVSSTTFLFHIYFL
jgi:hypothetical protein